MREYLKFYINGEWVDPVEPRTGQQRAGCPEELFLGLELAMSLPTRPCSATAADAVPIEAANIAVYSTGSGGHGLCSMFQFSSMVIRFLGKEKSGFQFA